jgi:hypothetical protein
VADRVVLHIGAPKSGTTFLQSVLWNSKERLDDGGVLLPGQRRFDHTQAALAVTNAHRRRRTRRGPRQAAWNHVIAAVRRWPGSVLISDEWFVLATAAQVRWALDDLRPAEVHVVFSARDFVRQVPAAWQEELKLGLAGPIDDFLAAFDSGGKWSWATLDAAEVLPRWARWLPADRIHVVTVPAPGAPRELLWQRFAEAAGFPADLGDVNVVEPNESLGVEAARLLELLGPDLRTAIAADTSNWTVQYRWLRRYFGHSVLVPLGGAKIGLRDETVDRLRAKSAESAKVIAGSGWHVVGDLVELAGADQPPGTRHPASVTDAELLDVARQVIPRFLQDLRNATQRAERRPLTREDQRGRPARA